MNHVVIFEDQEHRVIFIGTKEEAFDFQANGPIIKYFSICEVGKKLKHLNIRETDEPK